MIKMEKIKVDYQAGPSRYTGKGIDYMLVEVDGVELYAELENPTWDAEKEVMVDELATYEELKTAITEQAIENGIDPQRLTFWHF